MPSQELCVTQVSPLEVPVRTYRPGASGYMLGSSIHRGKVAGLHRAGCTQDPEKYPWVLLRAAGLPIRHGSGMRE